MDTSEAIVAFSQCEKIKSGLLWAIHLGEMRESIPQGQREGADKFLETLIDMIGHEIQIIKNRVKDGAWDKTERSINTALVMIRSRVPEESGFHLTHAIAHVTSLGHKALSYLKEQGHYDG
ncbi:MAG: hypothetical protein R6U27_02965 [Desulfobacterales bacterium]